MLDSSSDSILASSGSRGYWAGCNGNPRHTRSGVTPANIEAWNFAMLLIVHLPCSPNIQLITAVILSGPELVLFLTLSSIQLESNFVHHPLHTAPLECSEATRSVYLIQRLSSIRKLF